MRPGGKAPLERGDRIMDESAGISPPAGPVRFPIRIWLISLAGWMFDFYDLVLFSFLLIPIGRDLHMTPSDEALLLGVALGGSGIGGIVFGYLSDLRGRRYVMTTTIVVYSLGTALTALSTGFWSLLAFRLITGLGVGGEWAVGHALLAESTPGRMRGRAAAFLQAGEPIGVGLAAVVGLLVTPLIGWRWVCADLLDDRGAGLRRPPSLAGVHALADAEGRAAVAGRGAGAALQARTDRRDAEGVAARRLQDGHLLDDLHVVPEVPAERVPPARRAVGDLDPDRAARAIPRHGGIRLRRRSVGAPTRLHGLLAAHGGGAVPARVPLAGTAAAAGRCSGACCSRSASGRAARPGSARCWPSCFRPTFATSPWAPRTTWRAACSSSPRWWSARP